MSGVWWSSDVAACCRTVTRFASRLKAAFACAQVFVPRLVDMIRVGQRGLLGRYALAKKGLRCSSPAAPASSRARSWASTPSPPGCIGASWAEVMFFLAFVVLATLTTEPPKIVCVHRTLDECLIRRENPPR
jgi:hypothetical protein